MALPGGASHSASSVKTAEIRSASWLAKAFQAFSTMSRLGMPATLTGRGWRGLADMRRHHNARWAASRFSASHAETNRSRSAFVSFRGTISTSMIKPR